MNKQITSILIISLLACIQCLGQLNTYSSPLGYGLKMGLNYSTTKGNRYIGTAMWNLNAFIAKPLGSHFNLMLEPGFSANGIRDEQSDTRFRNYNLDLGLTSYIYPSNISKDFAFIIGVRPSYLMSYTSEVFEIGTYVNRNLAINKNVNGQIDWCGNIGVSVALSPILNIDLIYNQSFRDQNNDVQIKGRPSSIEFGMRLNAVSLKRNLDSKTLSLQEQLSSYHKGALFVMLITPSAKMMERLREERKFDELKWLQNEYKTLNKLSISSFSHAFDFCPVYYFYDTCIQKILAGERKGVFLNKKQEPDTSIVPTESTFFVASFCEDISAYTNRTHYGLFVYDANMIQLEKPFNHPNQTANPVYSLFLVNGTENMQIRKPTYTTVPHERLVGKFNTRLFRYLGN